MKELETKLAEAIYDAIRAKGESEGNFNVEVEDGDLSINVDGFFETDGYCENDYFNGTGAYVNTRAYVSISDVNIYDQEKGEESDADIDFAKVERLVEEDIAA